MNCWLCRLSVESNVFTMAHSDGSKDMFHIACATRLLIELVCSEDFNTDVSEVKARALGLDTVPQYLNHPHYVHFLEIDHGQDT